MAPCRVKSALRCGVRCIANILIEELEVIIHNQKNKRRRLWVKEWIRRRNSLGASEALLRELADEDPNMYTNHLRMTENNFEWLLGQVKHAIQKEDTLMRPALPARTKLQITLRYLATGDSLASLQYLYRVPKCSISLFLPEVLDAVFTALKDYIQVPDREEAWKTIQKGFEEKCNFPGCIGAVDCKHVVVRNPPHSGSDFYNYKSTFSIILFAVVDSNYSFSYINVGANGRMNDANIFRHSDLYTALEKNDLNIPPGGVFVADNAFPLRVDIMKPYARSGTLNVTQRIFNYRLSRARRIVENAFGILVSKFRIFERPINVQLSTADRIVKATCALHNWLRINSLNYITHDTVDTEDHERGSIVPGTWRLVPRATGLINYSERQAGNRFKNEAKLIRDRYAQYFSNEGAVPWQLKMI